MSITLRSLVLAPLFLLACPAPDGGGGEGEGEGGEGEGEVDLHAVIAAAVDDHDWQVLDAAPTVAGGAKQDDVFFVDDDTGFVASGPTGQVLKTTDGGASWNVVLESDTAFFRAVLFVDANHGFVGNLGAGLAASISDATLLFETTDGGDSWTPVVNIDGDVSAAKGVCNLNAVDADTIVAVGRANGPAALLISGDGGAHWTAKTMATELSMAIDVHFFSADVGLVAGMDPGGNACRIVRTDDGGDSFTTVFTSEVDASLCWKLNFPTPDVGFAAVQGTSSGPGTVARTRDGGLTWEEIELPLVNQNRAYSGIGVGFIDDRTGWLAAEDAALPVFRTFDGGDTWDVDPVLTGPINRFRVVNNHLAYASGASIWKLELPELVDE